MVYSTFFFFLTIFSILSSCRSSYAESLPTAFDVKYDVVFKGDLEYEYKQGCISTNNKLLWIVVGTRPKGNLGGPQQLWLWQLNSQGEKTFEYNFEKLPKEKIPDELGALSDIAGVIPLSSGGILLVLFTETGRPLLAKFDDSGKLLLLKPILTNEGDVFFSKILPAPKDTGILIGRIATRAAAVTINATGEILSKIMGEDQDEEVVFFQDAALSTDRELYLLGKYGSGSRLWLGSYNDKSELRNAVTLDGEKGSMIFVREKALVVAFSRAEGKKLTIWLNGYNPQLIEQWKEKLLDKENTPPTPPLLNISATPKGNLLAVMDNENKLLMKLSDDQGKAKWSHLFKNSSLFSEILWNVDIIRAAQDFIVPMTMLNVDPKFVEQRQELRILRFSLE